MLNLFNMRSFSFWACLHYLCCCCLLKFSFLEMWLLGFLSKADYEDYKAIKFRSGRKSYYEFKKSDVATEVEYLLLKRLGFRTKSEYQEANRCGFALRTQLDSASQMGFHMKEDYDRCLRMGFKSKADYDECNQLGCKTKMEFEEQKESTKMGFDDVVEYYECLHMGFKSKADYEQCKERGFFHTSDIFHYKSAGFQNKDTLDELIRRTMQFNLPTSNAVTSERQREASLDRAS